MPRTCTCGAVVYDDGLICPNCEAQVEEMEELGDEGLEKFIDVYQPDERAARGRDFKKSLDRKIIREAKIIEMARIMLRQESPSPENQLVCFR